MNIFKKGIRRLMHILGEKKVISTNQTIKWLHFIELGRWPNLKKPIDINEKLMWLEINSDTSEWSRLSDKYEVRGFIKDCGFENTLVKLIGIYESINEIDFRSLPESFVIKSTNGSSQTIIVKDKTKVNIPQITKQIESWFKLPFGLATGEKHYLQIKPRIIIEELLPTKDGEHPLDYKFYCFNGKAEYCLILSERNIQKESYKINLKITSTWEEVSDAIKSKYLGKVSSETKPPELQKMISMAEKLSKKFPFVRVDLYNIEGKIFFGEMTFTPAGCRTPYFNKDFIVKLGNLME